MELIIDPRGTARSIYSEEFDFACPGEPRIRRASFVEPDERGQWWADLSPSNGPKLGPFAKRCAALEAEVQWLRLRALQPIESQNRRKESL